MWWDSKLTKRTWLNLLYTLLTDLQQRSRGSHDIKYQRMNSKKTTTDKHNCNFPSKQNLLYLSFFGCFGILQAPSASSLEDNLPVYS